MPKTVPGAHFVGDSERRDDLGASPAAPAWQHTGNTPYMRTRRRWNDVDGWRIDETLVPLRGEYHSGGTGIATLEFSRRYGAELVDPTETVLGVRAPLNLDGHWVQCNLLVGGEGSEPQMLFVGRVELEGSEIDGSPEADGTSYPQGAQVWTAFGPERILEKVNFHHAHFYAGADATTEVEWLPEFNLRGPRGMLMGNRSAERVFSSAPTASYVFGGDGGTAIWSHRDILDYVLMRMVNRALSGSFPNERPYFTLGGDALPALSQMQTHVHVGDVANVWRLLQQLINPDFGIDFKLVPFPSWSPATTLIGFEINVFATSKHAFSFAGYELPGNPSSGPLMIDRARGARVTIERSSGDLVDEFVLIGERVITCASSGTSPTNNFTAGWGASLQSEYEAGDTLPAHSTPAVPADIAALFSDAFRQDERFRDVHQLFVLSSGQALYRSGAGVLGEGNPAFGDDGTLLLPASVTTRRVNPSEVVETSTAGYANTFQSSVRRTLSWVPLLEQWDYSPSTGVIVAPSGAPSQAEFRPPFVAGSIPVPGSSPAQTRWVAVDQFGVFGYPPASLAALDNEWGIRARCTPNHVLAGSGGYANSQQQPITNGRNLAWLLAVETDRRVRVRMALPTDEASGLGLRRVAVVSDAHFWWLPRRTLIGTNEHGLVTTAPDVHLILRDDRALLGRVMAGARKRFLQVRTRLRLSINSLETYHHAVGVVYDALHQAAQRTGLDALITSVSWDFQNRTTTLLAGETGA